MNNKEKMQELISEIEIAIDNNDFEDALTLLEMLRRVEQLEEWLNY
jgi:hypothetical protein